jgi:hypothetical protein
MQNQVPRTFVKVPVLSEQMTDTAPSVSTVFSDLHKILFFLIKLAVIVKLAVKAIGRPSGMKAIATLTQSTINVGTLIQSGCWTRSHEALGSRQSVKDLDVDRMITHQTIITTRIMDNIMEQIKTTNRRTSFSKVVRPVFGSPVSFAILPKTVESPVETTMPVALPAMQ